MKKILRGFAMMLTLALLCGAGLAEVVQPTDDFWFYDGADVLSERTEGEIFFANQRLYDACGAEIVVVTLDSTGRLGLEDYAYTLFNDWEIGGSSYLGMLLLMDIGSEDYTAMLGTKLEGYLDSAAVGDLLDDHLEPDFAKGDYDEGAKKFFEAAFEEIADALNVNVTVQQGKADYEVYLREEAASDAEMYYGDEIRWQEESRSSISFGQILLIIVILVLLFGGGSRGRRRSGGGDGLFRWMVGSHILRDMTRPRPPFGHGSHFRPGPPPGPGRPFGGAGRGGFGGSSRSGFGGASRGSSGRSFGGSSRSGFGGARRSGGASRGPSTRGGGASRGGRR